MAEDTVGQPRTWNGSLGGRVTAFASQYQATLVAVALALAAFSVYHFAGAPESPYNNFVRLADALLHGRIDIANGAQLNYIEFAIEDGKYYVIPPPWPAVMILPGVMVWGLELNQTLVSAVLGGIAASVVFLISRRFSDKLEDQVWLTALALFGTVFWYAAANGGVWFFSHTTAVLFLFFAIFFTLVRPNPLMAGLCLGAAYWSRQPTILSFPFFLIMFSDLWLAPPAAGVTLWRRLNPRPLMELGAGLGTFVLLSFGYNYMRFGTPFDASQHHLPESVLAQPWFNHGPFDYRYASRHVVTIFESMPIVRSASPYVVISLSGMALWMTTPAYFIALFNRVRDRRVLAVGIVLLLIGVGIPLSRALSGLWDSDWYTYTFPRHVNILPFYILIAAALWFSRRDKFALACWAAIIPTALMLFTFAGNGFAQFGYRFSLDYMPFLFLLTAHTVRNDMKWYHKALIALSVIANLWGVLWVYHFQQDGFLDKIWVVP